MISIPVSMDMVNAFYSIVKSKSTYLGFLIRSERLCIYAELNEIYYLALCKVEGAPDISLRLPVEVMRVIMNIGHLELETMTHNDGTTSEKIASYDNSNRLRCSVEIASEYSDNEAQILDLLKTVFQEECIIINNPEIFETALGLTRVNMKELGIKGVNIRDGKMFTLANGFAAYRDDPVGLSLVISTSSLKELVSFCAGKKNVRLQKHVGFNICSAGTSIIAWRRVRADQFIDIPEVKYDLSVTIPTEKISKVFRFVTTEVSDCVLNFKEGMLEVYSQVGNYSVPLDIEPHDIKNIRINYKLISKLLNTNVDKILLEANEYTLHLCIDGTHYLMGVRQE